MGHRFIQKQELLKRNYRFGCSPKDHKFIYKN